jgi:hypothetical protein
MELDQPLCLQCARLDDLEFLPSGDTALTRRATRLSTGEVSFAKLGRKTVFQAVKDIFANQPARTIPIIEVTPTAPVLPAQAAVSMQEPAPVSTGTEAFASADGPPSPGSGSGRRCGGGNLD